MSDILEENGFVSNYLIFFSRNAENVLKNLRNNRYITYVFVYVVNRRRRHGPWPFCIRNFVGHFVAFGKPVQKEFLVLQQAQPHVNL